MSERPELTSELTGQELRRWYWTMAELQPFARSRDLSSSGPKADLIDRIAASLDGAPAPTPSRRSKRSTSQSPRQLEGDLALDTVIPHGQRSTTLLRTFFTKHIGPSFRFDGHMRTFLTESDGATLADAIDHWHATRGQELPPQSKSLEFNGFTRAWHAAHPDGSATDCREAWMRYRALPVDQRPPIADA